MASPRKPSVSGPVEQHIRTVARMEEMHEEQTTGLERVAGAVAAVAGTKLSLLLHLSFFVGWLLINSGHLHAVRPFDRYPFSLLSTVVSSEAVLLTVFVLFKQNQAQRRDEHLSQLNLQIDLLTEKEVTKALQLLRAVCSKLEIAEPAGDAELSEMSQVTSVGGLADRIMEDLPPKH